MTLNYLVRKMKNILICYLSLVTMCSSSALNFTYNVASFNSMFSVQGLNCSSLNESLSIWNCNSSLTKQFKLCEGETNITACVENCNNTSTHDTGLPFNCSLNISINNIQNASLYQLTCKIAINQTTTPAATTSATVTSVNTMSATVTPANTMSANTTSATATSANTMSATATSANTTSTTATSANTTSTATSATMSANTTSAAATSANTTSAAATSANTMSATATSANTTSATVTPENKTSTTITSANTRSARAMNSPPIQMSTKTEQQPPTMHLTAKCAITSSLPSTGNTLTYTKSHVITGAATVRHTKDLNNPSQATTAVNTADSNETTSNTANGAQEQEGLSKTAVAAISASASVVGVVSLVSIVIFIIKKKKAGAVLPNEEDDDDVHET